MSEGRPLHVLVAEDNAVNRELLTRRLTRAGLVVHEAIDGEAALRAVAHDRPDIIVMDLTMPVLDGWEAARRLKAEPSTRTIPIIALTANAMAGDEETALAAGCDAYATKPVHMGDLLALIEHLARRAPSRAPRGTAPSTG